MLRHVVTVLQDGNQYVGRLTGDDRQWRATKFDDVIDLMQKDLPQHPDAVLIEMTMVVDVPRHD